MKCNVLFALLFVFASPAPCFSRRMAFGAAGHLNTVNHATQAVKPLTWEDSNIAKIGSDEDKDVRKAAAQNEPAWEGAGSKPGIQVWRIEKFKVLPWPEDRYGEFYSGDSYIVMQTMEDEDSEKSFNIFFWLGKESSTDEQGTAAYKTVELDDFLDGKAVQNREVQGDESSEFRSLFREIIYLEGGAESGFSVVSPDTYQTRLLHVRRLKDNTIKAKEVTLSRASLNQGDSFVLDAGTTLYVWDGSHASPFEKYAANRVAKDLQSHRSGKAQATHEIDDAFWETLGGEGDIAEADAHTDEDLLDAEVNSGDGVLYRLSEESGSLTSTEVARGELNKSMLNSDGVMMLDLGAEMFIWIGSGASSRERRAAYTAGVRYLKVNGKPSGLPIHIYKEGLPVKNPTWMNIFAN